MNTWGANSKAIACALLLWALPLFGGANVGHPLCSGQYKAAGGVPSAEALIVPGVTVGEPGSSFKYDKVVFPDGNFDLYKGATSVLLLGDGDPKGNYSPIGKKVAAALPDAKVVCTDIGFEGEKTEGNLTTKHLDHTKPLPFGDNQFDMLVMSLGLCHCRPGNKCCAGFALQREAIATFLHESVRVLNKKNPKAGIYFLNREQGWAQDIKLWQAAAADVVAKDPSVKVEILRDFDGKFDGLRITPK